MDLFLAPVNTVESKGAADEEFIEEKVHVAVGCKVNPKKCFAEVWNIMHIKDSRTWTFKVKKK
jgi:hypothetical protein